jgi:hypothetical protein
MINNHFGGHMKAYESICLVHYKEYLDFINICRSKVYDDSEVKHKHHIIPRCLGGNDSIENLVILNVEDHIQAHIKMSKIFEDGTDGNIHNLRSARVLNKNSVRTKEELELIRMSYVGENNPFYGKTHSEENIQKLRERNKEVFGDKTYDEIYKDRADSEREKRRIAAIKQHENMSTEEKLELSNKIKASQALIPPEIRSERARKAALASKSKIKIDGNIFDCMTDACNHFGVTLHFLKKLYKIEKVK